MERALRRIVAAALAAAAFGTPSLAQGSDDCAAAQPIAGFGGFAVDTSGASTDGPANACGEAGQIHGDVWFLWTSHVSGIVELNTCLAATFDTTIAVYPASACPVGVPIVCNDDSCVLQSRAAFGAVTGAQYLVRVGGWNAVASGQTTLTIRGVGGAPNDTCVTADTIAGFGTFAADTSLATTDGVADGCGLGGQIHRDVWFAWTAPTTDAVEVSTCSATFDTTIAVYESTACPTGAPIACNDDACSIQTRVGFQATGGMKYLIRLGGFNESAAGALTFDVAVGTSFGCQNPPLGPDVIVADLPAVQNYGGHSGVGGYSLATTACNVGDSVMNWNGSNALHPVIGQNLYRIEDGAIRQLGLSWLKHGFASATGTYCCTCVSPGSSQIMGVGCSDPYGATTNGVQSNLGPRSEVDPWTGVFPYPFSTQGQSGSDVTFKRLQVPNADLDPAVHGSAEFVLEGQYVTPDDAAAGNQHNNCSWAPASVGSFTSGAYRLAVAGPTSVGEPAIYAWQAVDPAVRIERAAAPGDGTFHVASRAHDMGDGTWRYEYAVHNEISARAARSFTVPFELGVDVLGTAFHDVDHHSGEPWDATDWTVRIEGDRVVWDTDDHATNPNANALRWGTMYGFTVVADVAPSSGEVTLGMFAPGIGDALRVPAVVPGAPPLGERYCGPAVHNSSGLPAEAHAVRSATVADNALTLVALRLPQNTVGFFLGSRTEDFVMSPGGSSGDLCLGGTIARFRAQVMGSGATGRFDVPIDLLSIPLSPPVAVQPGETWRFQAWFRDQLLPGVSSSNFTDGVRVTFD